MTEGWLGDVDRYLGQIEQDPMFQMELDLCETLGIRHSRYLEWSSEDQAKALANLIWVRKEKFASCHHCGTKPSEWVDPETKRKVYPAPYVVEWTNCEGCNDLERDKRNHEGDASDPGMRSRLVPNPEASD